MWEGYKCVCLCDCDVEGEGKVNGKEGKGRYIQGKVRAER